MMEGTSDITIVVFDIDNDNRAPKVAPQHVKAIMTGESQKHWGLFAYFICHKTN